MFNHNVNTTLVFICLCRYYGTLIITNIKSSLTFSFIANTANSAPTKYPIIIINKLALTEVEKS